MAVGVTHVGTMVRETQAGPVQLGPGDVATDDVSDVARWLAVNTSMARATSERRLWIAVIRQAIAETGWPHTCHDRRAWHVRRCFACDAVEWIAGDEFVTVVELIGGDVASVRRLATEGGRRDGRFRGERERGRQERRRQRQWGTADGQRRHVAGGGRHTIVGPRAG